MNIQWFPGHMAKTRRILAENLKLVDVAVELLDARIPHSSRNPEINEILKDKPKVMVLNKADLADDKISSEWRKHFAAFGNNVIFMDSLRGKGVKELKSLLRELVSDRIEKDRSKGRIFRPIRTMVVGIPNVGKSSFINKLSGSCSAVTGDKPGVTRGKQWIRINPEIELLDTPGILWPKFDDPQIGLRLAFTGAIKDEIIDITEVASHLLHFLATEYAENLAERYKLTDISEKTGLELLEAAGRKRGCIISGGEVDLMRIAAIVLDEFRGGKIGKISLERP